MDSERNNGRERGKRRLRTLAQTTRLVVGDDKRGWWAEKAKPKEVWNVTRKATWKSEKDVSISDHELWQSKTISSWTW
jgi:hypothetical protein